MFFSKPAVLSLLFAAVASAGGKKGMGKNDPLENCQDFTNTVSVTFTDSPFLWGGPADLAPTEHNTYIVDFVDQGWDANAVRAHLTCAILYISEEKFPEGSGLDGYPQQVTSECTFRTLFDDGSVMIWEGLELLDISRGFGGPFVGPWEEFSEYAIVGGTKQWVGATGEVRIVCDVAANVCSASGYVCKSDIAMAKEMN
uniref:Uncharacterized protein n=1 Tax=Entomoneis paludosa TaxID=265537 RepID=A0A7S2YJ11_9STRA